ncbi:type VI secretion system protein TssL, long form [Caballeronia sp. BR00000012568055]|uniref:type VI secretion system protein TssL, long form n=1 Tax=Caballeronia sp. BR00000012568055 TaxID=2918761 RepID=UPI00351A1B78
MADPTLRAFGAQGFAPTPAQDAGVTPHAGIPPAEPYAARLQAVQQSHNPLLEAARPLLRALADMPADLELPAIDQLHLLLKQEVRVFQRLCEQANVRRDHMIGARYCLCTALDDAATQTRWGKREIGVRWIATGLATEFHEDRHGGDKVFLLTARLMQNAGEHIDLLEIVYRILSLGFLGRYRHEVDGARKHDAVRKSIFKELQAQRAGTGIALSPHGHSTARGHRLSLRDFPVWMSFAVAGVIVTGLFCWYKYHLLTRGDALEQRIIEIGRLTPPPARLLRLKQLLRDEIAAGTVSVDEDDRHSAVTFRGDAMFASGGVAVKASMNPLIDKIANEINKVPGRVVVTGYTDSTPIRTSEFASNVELSQKRAMHVAQRLQQAGVAPSRLEAIGRGDAEPLGDNATAAGRALNRRVAITVTP